MGLFDRRKDAPSPTPDEPVAEEVAATKKVAAAPPAPPAAPEAAQPDLEPGQPEPPPVAASEAQAPSAPSGPAIHTVSAGESLADLASRYGVPAEEIARQNHVPPPGEIHPGQVFVIRS